MFKLSLDLLLKVEIYVNPCINFFLLFNLYTPVVFIEGVPQSPPKVQIHIDPSCISSIVQVLLVLGWIALDILIARVIN